MDKIDLPRQALDEHNGNRKTGACFAGVAGDGTIAVPTAPGLGYEVDLAALKRCELPPMATPSLGGAAKL
jgi:hypothetical protein